MLAVVPAQSEAVIRAQAIAADLRYVLRKHKARIVWREELDGRVTVTAVIENAPEGRSLVASLAPWWRRIFSK